MGNTLNTHLYRQPLVDVKVWPSSAAELAATRRSTQFRVRVVTKGQLAWDFEEALDSLCRVCSASDNNKRGPAEQAEADHECEDAEDGNWYNPFTSTRRCQQLDVDVDLEELCIGSKDRGLNNG